MEDKKLYKIRSVIFGHAVGDALGVPVEFCRREDLDAEPVDGMRGYGSYPYAAGAWSDDTSMTLCALDSLAKGAVDWDEIMRNFETWIDEGEYTSVGECFDAGPTCVMAIRNYLYFHPSAVESGGTDEMSNGNGSLMRILPFVLFAEYGKHEGDWLDLIHKASSMTHAHERSQVGCGIYAIVIRHLLKDSSMDSVYQGLRCAERVYRDSSEFYHYKRIFEPSFRETKRDDMKSTGYIVDTLEAAVWCLLTTDNYKDCVLKAVNLGDDTDTVAAIAGGMAGALYGYESIPQEWRETLMRRDDIEEMCKRAYGGWCSATK